MNFPDIETTSLELREISENDRQDIFEIFSNAEVVRYYDLEAFTKLEQADQLIRLFQERFLKSAGIRWGIFLKESGKCVGSCGFNAWSLAMRSATIGYDLNRDYWRKGIVTEALRAMLGLAFSGGLVCKDLNRIQADTIPGNIASEKLLLKLGFQEEGIRRQSGYWKGQFHDLKCFALLRNDFD